MGSDISAVADPNTGVAVYDSYGSTGGANWPVFGGTSVATPLVGGMYAVAGVTTSYPAATLYASGASLYDVVSGSNGRCNRFPSYFCNAGSGYDGPTGNGTPNGVASGMRRAQSRPVFLLVAVVVLIGIVLTKTPTNGSNVIVRNALRLAGEAVGPCKVVFAPKKPQDALVVNYLLAAVVYGVLGVVVGRLPTGRRR